VLLGILAYLLNPLLGGAQRLVLARHANEKRN